MRTGQEYLSSNSQVAYPFKDTAAGLVRNGGTMPLDVVVDAALEVPYSAPANGTRYYLMNIVWVDATSASLGIGDGSALLFSIPVSTVPTPFAVVAGRHTDGITTARLVIDTAALFDFLPTVLAQGGTISYASTLPFEEGVQAPASTFVNSIALYNNGPDEAPAGPVLTGDVQLLCGHNISAEQDGLPVGDLTSIRLSAIPLAGKGQLGCADEPTSTVGTMKGISPDHGNVTFEPGEDGCYQLVTSISGQIQLQGHCQACCTCQDYEDILNLLHTLAIRTNELRTTLDTARATYEDGVTYFNSVVVPRFRGHVMLTADGMRGSDWPVGDQRRGAPNWARVVFTCENRRNTTMSVYHLLPTPHWDWDFIIDPPHNNATIEDICWEYEGESEKTAFHDFLPDLLPHTKLSVTVLFKVALQDWLSSPAFRVTITTHWIGLYEEDDDLSAVVTIQ